MSRPPCCRIIFLFAVFGLCLQNAFPQSLCQINGEYEKYDDTFLICCKNKLQNRLRDQECCGGNEFYYKDKSLCCGENVFDRFVANCPRNSADCHPHCSPNDAHCSEQICCGNTTIFKSNSLCCNNNRIDLTDQQKLDIDFIQCCDAKLYDVRHEICCHGNVYQLKVDKTLQCCGTNSYLPWRNSCLVRIDNRGKKTYSISDSNLAVCGDDQIYNKVSAGCCKNVIYNVPEINSNWQSNPDFVCCDHLLYNPLKEKCCRKHHSFYFDSHIIPNKEELDCCGTGYYNKSAEICKNGTVVKKQFDKKLCGFSYYNPEVEGCCDFVIYDKQKSKCCKGSTSNVARREDKCCNGVGMDKNHICCDGLLAKKNHQDDSECCFSNDFTKAEGYSRERGERCYEGNVISGYREGTDPCGRHGYYDPRKEICCNSMVFNSSYGCCDVEAYKIDDQMCCFDNVQNLPAALARCCNLDGKAYTFNDRSNPCKSPCGTDMYDSAEEVCCNNKIYRQKRDFECCGDAYININRKECCADKHPYKISGHLKCCANKELFNAKAFSCNPQGLVVPKYTNLLCQPRMLQSFHKTKHLACNTTYGVRGKIDKVSLTIHNRSETDTLNIYLTADAWINTDTGSSAEKLTNIYPPLTFHVQVYKTVSAKCTQHLQAKTRVMVLFDSKPTANIVTISPHSMVFLYKYTPKREQEIEKCKLRSVL